MQERLVRLFEETYGVTPAAVLEVAGDGSNRSYRRLIGPDGERAVGAIGPDHDENRAFLHFSRAFHAIGLPVPEVYAEDVDHGVYLMEDLGDSTLFDVLSAAREDGAAPAAGFPESLRPIYLDVARTLPRFQVEGHSVVDYSVAYPHAAFDRRSVMWDLNYFKYHFLKLAHVPFHEARLEADFDRLADHVLAADDEYFLYRDFQSRNVMVTPEGARYIDYQGGRRGAAQYDIASLLYDAKADLPAEFRAELFDVYFEALSERRSVARASFEELFRGFVLTRILQALGAYGYRGFFERKPRFLKSVPFAARNLESLLETGLAVRLPELEDVLRRIADTWAGEPTDGDDDASLTVHIRSFSYRRGYPEDRTGHGGGHVFDCRAIPNPGRRLEYRALTGLDASVREFLRAQPAAHRFLEQAELLCRSQVEAYLERGFDRFSVSFGCTGGQHRSVFFAEELAERLRAAFPTVRVRLEHRERTMWPARSDPASREASTA